MTRILLRTGGSGFIGSAVVRQALRAGYHVINLDALTYAANPITLKESENHPHYKFEHANVCDAQTVSALLSKYYPDAVMHLAAESHVDRSLEGPAAFIQTNVIGTFTLLEAVRGYYETLPAAKKANFRLHHISTDEVYGDLEPDDPAFTERSSYQPSSPYAASKAGSDHLVRAWARSYGLPVVVSNTSNNYGPYQFPEKLIPVVILSALHGRPIPIYGTGDNVRDWLYVEDHAHALLAVLERGTLGESYNIGGNAERTNIDLVEDICALLDERRLENAPHSQLIKFVTDRPGHDKRYAINSSKAFTELGITPAHSLREGLAKTVDWYLSRQDWWGPLVTDGTVGQRLGLKI